ncbi:MAG: trypsin-like peptidase domain-containing protein, partial [Planctomycetes bacterium]|nr:trypsin-like peptidase domain-containing protein [Planctomycetota bacterium]
MDATDRIDALGGDRRDEGHCGDEAGDQSAHNGEERAVGMLARGREYTRACDRGCSGRCVVPPEGRRRPGGDAAHPTRAAGCVAAVARAPAPRRRLAALRHSLAARASLPCSPPARPAGPRRRMAYPQVVRVYSTYQDPDYECPWQSVAPRGSTGSGVIVGPGQVLTGAHVVANATFVQVQKQDDVTKVVARVAVVSHDCDLALLQVEDPAFTAGIAPARIGDLPRLREAVQVLCYP